jgi:MFS family permease
VDEQRVIRTYLTITGIFTLSASLIWGINTLFLLEAGLSIFEVFVANAAFTAAMALFEVPTGVVADTRGRRISFLLSEATLAVGTLAYVAVAAMGGGVVWFSLAGIILGLGYTFYSGAVEAWMVDALRATGFRGELDHAFARGGMVASIAMLVGTVAGGIIGSVDLSIPYLVRAGLVMLAFAVGFRSMHDLGFTPRTMHLRGIVGEMRKVGRAGLRFGWSKTPVRLLMLTSFVSYGFFSWAWYAWQPYFLELLERDLVWVSGLIAALFALASMGGNAIVTRVARPGMRRTTILLGGSAIASACYVATGAVQVFWIAVPVFIFASFIGGVTQPVRQTYFHGLIPTDQRATLVSFDSLIGSVGSIGGQTGLGWLSQERSIAAGFVVGGLSTLVALPIFARLRARGESADVIRSVDEVEPDAVMK